MRALAAAERVGAAMELPPAEPAAAGAEKNVDAIAKAATARLLEWLTVSFPC